MIETIFFFLFIKNLMNTWSQLYRDLKSGMSNLSIIQMNIYIYIYILLDYMEFIDRSFFLMFK